MTTERKEVIVVTYVATFHSPDSTNTYYVNVDDISHIVSKNTGSILVFKTNHFDLELKENAQEVLEELYTRRSLEASGN